MSTPSVLQRRGRCTYLGMEHYGAAENGDVYREIMCGQFAREHDDSRGHRWQRDMTPDELRRWKRTGGEWFS